MDSFSKAAKQKEDEINLLEQTNPTGKLSSMLSGAEVDFSTKDPFAGLPEVPGAQAAIDEARAKRAEAKKRAEAASDAWEAFAYGAGEPRFKEKPGSFFGMYGEAGGSLPGSYGRELLKAEAKGLLTLSPKFKADLQKYRSLNDEMYSLQDAYELLSKE